MKKERGDKMGNVTINKKHRSNLNKYKVTFYAYGSNKEDVQDDVISSLVGLRRYSKLKDGYLNINITKSR